MYITKQNIPCGIILDAHHPSSSEQKIRLCTMIQKWENNAGDATKRKLHFQTPKSKF